MVFIEEIQKALYKLAFCLIKKFDSFEKTGELFFVDAKYFFLCLDVQKAYFKKNPFLWAGFFYVMKQL